MHDPGQIIFGCIVGFLAWFIVRCLVMGFFTVNQNERAVKTCFGRAERVGTATTLDDPIAESLQAETTPTLLLSAGSRNPSGRAVFQMAVGKGLQGHDRDADDEHGLRPGNSAKANDKGTVLEAVTKDQLNTGLKGQIRYRVSEKNLYAYLFGVNHPIVACDGIFCLHPARTDREFRGARAEAGARGRDEAGADHGRDRHLDQRPAQKPERHQRSHGQRMRFIGSAVWNHAGCVADHGDRSAAGGRVGAGGDQHGV